ncbi:hypothetical protein M099_2267 [Phocaeicola vulgatus str. 3975 RP4]|uniref:Uncharacterized protein n=3 Tax=Phocaeicola vulgatus TaxID=821 RepID=A0A078RHC4_PHOVU|nr:conserved domain protein [Phocaeicola vulgatus PC510]KDS33342.1 hypothetical protein M097_0506 [Phocaeicola vulgatus str. 3775 SL(B) 10 (iv)]KDS38965.1 hypothetical protein M098_3731 [Phocaeicola vulgatus str. 3775 SR(B) 19]KDS53843.1 hypothetical protein M099_2267 [Phocaeicola vulgatus str. 3975 RP4]
MAEEGALPVEEKPVTRRNITDMPVSSGIKAGMEKEKTRRTNSKKAGSVPLLFSEPYH